MKQPLDGLAADLQAGMTVAMILLNPLIFIRLIYTDLKIEGTIERRGCDAGSLARRVIEFSALLLSSAIEIIPLARPSPIRAANPDGPTQGWLFVDTPRCSAEQKRDKAKRERSAGRMEEEDHAIEP